MLNDGFRVRRVVVGRGHDGAPVVVSDGTPPLTIDAPTGFGVSELLSSAGPLTSTDSGGDPPREAVGAFPANGGVAARLIRFPATNEWVRIAGDDPERPGMHRSETLDLMVVLSGRIMLGVEDGEAEIGPGDAVIQRGTLHRWRVTGNAPCTYLSVLLAPIGGEIGPSASLPKLGADGGPKLFVTGPGPHGSIISSAGPTAPDERGYRRWWDTGGPLRSVDQGNIGAVSSAVGDIGAPSGQEEQPVPGAVSLTTVDLAAAGTASYRTGSGSIDLVTVLSGTVTADLGASAESPLIQDSATPPATGAEPREMSLSMGDVLITRDVALRLRSGTAQMAVVSFVPLT